MKILVSESESTKAARRMLSGGIRILPEQLQFEKHVRIGNPAQGQSLTGNLNFSTLNPAHDLESFAKRPFIFLYLPILIISILSVEYLI